MTLDCYVWVHVWEAYCRQPKYIGSHLLLTSTLWPWDQLFRYWIRVSMATQGRLSIPTLPASVVSGFLPRLVLMPRIRRRMMMRVAMKWRRLR